MISKKISVILGVALLALPVFAFAETTSTVSLHDTQSLQAIIAQLQAQIKTLQSQ